MALNLAAREPRLAACVSYFPSIRDQPPATEANPTAVADQIGCSVQVLYGTADHVTSLATFAALRTALEARVALLITTGLPRLDRSRPDPRPVLDDYGAMGGIAQLSDVVLGLYREEMYRPGFGNEGGTELLLLKNRNGATGY